MRAAGGGEAGHHALDGGGFEVCLPEAVEAEPGVSDGDVDRGHGGEGGIQFVRAWRGGDREPQPERGAGGEDGQAAGCTGRREEEFGRVLEPVPGYVVSPDDRSEVVPGQPVAESGLRGLARDGRAFEEEGDRREAFGVGAAGEVVAFGLMVSATAATVSSMKAEIERDVTARTRGGRPGRP